MLIRAKKYKIFGGKSASQFAVIRRRQQNKVHFLTPKRRIKYKAFSSSPLKALFFKFKLIWHCQCQSASGPRR
jgi:hypothetical protein